MDSTKEIDRRFLARLASVHHIHASISIANGANRDRFMRIDVDVHPRRINYDQSFRQKPRRQSQRYFVYLGIASTLDRKLPYIIGAYSQLLTVLKQDHRRAQDRSLYSHTAVVGRIPVSRIFEFRSALMKVVLPALNSPRTERYVLRRCSRLQLFKRLRQALILIESLPLND